MTKEIEIIYKPRLHLLEQIEGLTIEQLNKVSVGFNNNIAWNLAHIVSAQQGICYIRSGVDVTIEDRFFLPYRSGTKPEKFIDADELQAIKGLFTSTIYQLETDLQNNLFANYTPWTTRYGIEIRNIEDAIKFLPFHEGIHTGYVWALKRVVTP